MHVVLIGPFPAEGAAPRGGIESCLATLTEGLLSHNARVTAVCPGTEPTVARAGARTIYRLPYSSHLTTVTAFRAWRLQVKRVLTGLPYDLVHGHNLLDFGFAATDVTGVPRVVTAHGSPSGDAIGRGRADTLRAVMRERLARVVLSRADCAIGVNPDTSVNITGGPTQIRHIPNPIAAPFLDDTLPLDDHRAAIVLFIGDHRPVKGWQLLRDAWKMVCVKRPDAELRVIGPISSTPSQDTRVTALGQLSARDIALEMRRATCLVVPSLFEVSPIAVSEAWATGLPVVATRVGGIPPFVGDAAYMIDPTPDDIALGILQLLNNVDLRTRLRDQGATRARRHIGDRIATEHIVLYNELLEGSTSN